MMKTTEAERRAQKKYYQKHKEYYKQKTLEEMKRVRQQKHEYKARIDKAIEYIKEHNPSDIGICGNEKKYYYTLDEDSVDNLLNILQNGSDK